MRSLNWAVLLAAAVGLGCQGPAMYPASGGPYGAYPSSPYGAGSGGYVAPPATYVPPTPAGAGSTASGTVQPGAPSLPPGSGQPSPVPEGTSSNGF